MRRILMRTVFVATTFGVYACGGSTTPSPTSPTGTVAPPAGATIIDVVRENGAQSFSPNPATVPTGQMVVWHNVDTITHRVVFNDGSVDTGNLAPGASSQPMSIAAGAGGYHCSIHPVMVGSVNQSTSTAPAPCDGAYCN